jgi:hypothetical protein
MESKEKCEQIIQIFNGNPLTGSKEPLLVKFADGGNKKRSSLYKSPDQRMWRDGGEVICRTCRCYDTHLLYRNVDLSGNRFPGHIIFHAQSKQWRRNIRFRTVNVRSCSRGGP